MPENPPDDPALLCERIGTLEAQLAELNAALASATRTDSLTGLANRTGFNEKLTEALARSRRHGQALALLLLDVEGFKSINESFGHHCGDEVLQAFASRVVAGVRQTDSVGRLGGDEFGVILEDLHAAAEPQFIARKLITTIGRPFEMASARLWVSTCIGIAFQAPSSADAAALLAAADKALADAKSAGPNTFRLALS